MIMIQLPRPQPADVLIRVEPRLAEHFGRQELNQLSREFLREPLHQLTHRLLIAGKVRQQEARIEQ